ncbi:MAG: hypothetical protein JWO81_1213 [Alphaproteobacteria bacterium]|nr:hypothetical protein [Alphaproteobacteria bacterium]
MISRANPVSILPAAAGATRIAYYYYFAARAETD